MQLRSVLLGISAIVAMIVPVGRVGASVEPIIPTAAASEVPLDVRPARLVDTRPGATTIDGIDAGNGALAAGTSTDIQITGRAGIPTTATTAILTVTAVDPQGPGHLTVHPAGTTVPNASNLNYLPGHTTANTVIARIGLDGQITIHTHATTHLVIDITGHLPAGAATLTTAPERLVDTRPGATTIDGIDAGNGALAAGTSTDIQITGRAGIPTTATTAILTVTAVDPQGPGHLTVHPAGTTVPNASNLNYLPGHTTANTVIARIGLDGQITIHTHATTHLVIDITGHLPAGAATLTTAPERLVDTRPGATTIDGIDAGNGALAAGTSTDIQITGRAGIPTTATTAILTVTAVDPQGPGHLTVHPAGTTVPNASNLNYLPGHTTANTVIARIGLDGQITIHTHATTHLVIDITGHLPLSLDQVDFDELIVGRWTGDVTVPPGWSPITGFWVEFRVDGTYSAGSNGSTPAFYYGSDADHPSKVYEVVGRYPDEQPGTGAITIHFEVGTVREGSLEQIRFSSGGDRLQFEFWRTWAGHYGPVVYDLVRDPD